MKPGIYPMKDEQYFAHTAVSNSDLKEVARSPAHYKAYKATPRQETAAMREGSAIHCAVLEPDEFLRRYAVLPDNSPARPTDAMLKAKKPSPSSVERMEFWMRWEAENAGKISLSCTEAAEYMELGTAVRNHPELSVFFEKGFAERAVFGTDPVTGTLCKCKPDYLTTVRNYSVTIELKTTEDARPEAFQRTAFKFGYYQGAAWYSDVQGWSGTGAPDLYLFVVVERKAPYGIKVYELTPEALEFGQRRYRAALDLYAYCLEMDEWPVYDTKIEPLSLPNWAKD